MMSYSTITTPFKIVLVFILEFPPCPFRTDLVSLSSGGWSSPPFLLFDQGTLCNQMSNPFTYFARTFPLMIDVTHLVHSPFCFLSMVRVHRSCFQFFCLRAVYCKMTTPFTNRARTNQWSMS